MAGNRVVARFNNGRLVKGTTSDFFPNREVFHVETQDGEIVTVSHGELKAVFFVRDFRGNPSHQKKNRFDPSAPVIGRKIRVEFKDGEVIVGTTQGYQPDRPGFFLVPADSRSNAERCFVIAASTRKVAWV